MDQAKWGDEDDIDIDDELMQDEAANDTVDTTQQNNHTHQEESDIFVPPSSGADQVALAVRKYPLVAALHVATGDFGKALELLKKQLAISNYEPLK